MADAGLITRTVVFAVAAPVGSNILAASRAARDAAQAAATASAAAQAATEAAKVAAQSAQAAAETANSAAQAYATAAASSASASEVSRLAAVAAQTAAEAAQASAASSAAAALASKLVADADAAATAADRVQAGLDRTAAAASATAAAASVPVTADRVVGYRANNIALWTATRATPAYVRGPAGILVPAPADTLPFYFDASLAPKGPAFAGQRQNVLIGPRFEGGTVGAIGSGGVLPTGISLGVQPAGLTPTVAAFGNLADGSPYVDIRWTGTTTAAGVCRMVSLVPNATVFAASEVIAFATSYALVAGSLNGFTAYSYRTTGIAPAPNPATPAPTGALQRTVRTLTCTGGTTGAGAGYELLFNVASGQVIDATFRYVMPQLQRGPMLGSNVLPAPAASGPFTEAQTSADIDVAKLGVNWNYRQGTIIVDWSSRPGPFTSANDADWFGLVSWGDKTANERMGLLLNPAHTSIEARVTAGGVVQTAASRALTAPAADVTTRAALSWDLDAAKLQVAARGAAGAQVALSALPVPGWLMPGRYGTSHPGFVCIPGLEVRPAAVFDAALAALT